MISYGQSPVFAAMADRHRSNWGGLPRDGMQMLTNQSMPPPVVVKPPPPPLPPPELKLVSELDPLYPPP